MEEGLWPSGVAPRKTSSFVPSKGSKGVFLYKICILEGKEEDRLKRTHYCGAFREEHIGTRATAAGWVQSKRDMGGVLFIDLKDREGVLQVVFDARSVSPEHFQLAEGLRLQSVIMVSGKIRLRDAETGGSNPLIPTRSITGPGLQLRPLFFPAPRRPGRRLVSRSSR